jgi:hypothetical protein
MGSRLCAILPRSAARRQVAGTPVRFRIPISRKLTICLSNSANQVRSWMVGDTEAGQRKRASRNFAGFEAITRLLGSIDSRRSTADRQSVGLQDDIQR